MNFDELWRLNLAKERGQVNPANTEEAVGIGTVPGENPNELQLTAEDQEFLSKVGISYSLPEPGGNQEHDTISA